MKRGVKYACVIIRHEQDHAQQLTGQAEPLAPCPADHVVWRNPWSPNDQETACPDPRLPTTLGRQPAYQKDFISVSPV